MNQRIKPNTYKKGAAASNSKNRRAKGQGPKKGIKTLGAVCLLTLMSLGAIYTHDAIVQSPFFTVRTIAITGLDRVDRQEILDQAGITEGTNLFKLHLPTLESQLVRHPWVAQATVHRKLFSGLAIRIQEEVPLAIVDIENLADVIINTQGKPFKEYDPEKDNLPSLPVITGMDLSLSNSTYLFEGELFNAIMDLLEIQAIGKIKAIQGDENTGVTIKTLDTYNRKIHPGTSDDTMPQAQNLISIKLGFDRFEEKLGRARKISQYMESQFPSKTIQAMDLYDINKVFVKTEDVLFESLEKGV